MTDYLTPLALDALRAAGVPEPWTFGLRDRVRFYEIDALNHVNNTAYLRWFETLRVRWLSDYGISDYRPEDPTFVVKSITCDYRKPLFLHEDYIVTGRAATFRTTSFVKEYAVWRDGELCVTSSAVVVITDKSGTLKQPMSAAMKETLVARDGARDLST